MPQFSSKTDWLTQLETVNRLLQQDPNLTGRAISKQLDISKAQASYLTTLHDLLDHAAIQKIRSAALPSANKALGQSNPVAQLEASQQMPLSLQSALALAGLTKAKFKDLNSLVHAALDAALAQKLPTVQIKALAAWMVAGNSADTFNPQPLRREAGRTIGLKTKMSQANGNIDEPLAQSSRGTRLGVSSQMQMDLKKLRQALEKAETERIQGTGTSAEEKLKAHILQTAETLKGGPAAGESLGKTIALDWLADVNLIKKLQSKRKKGQSLTAGEWRLLLVHKTGEWLKQVVIGIFRLIHLIWKLVIDALKELGLYKYAKAILTLLAVAAAIWFGWEAVHYGVLRPVEMAWGKVHFSHATDNPAAQEPITAAEPVTSSELEVRSSNLKPKTSNSKLLTSNSTLVAAYHPAQPWTDEKSAPVWTREDQKVLETEIESVASRSFLKDYVMHPDETMPGDLCVSRLQDMTNPDKYTMKIGGSEVKVLAVSPSNQTLKIVYKSNDLFGVLGSRSGEMNIFWEDVRVIHVNEIDDLSKTNSLFANGNNGPLAQSSRSAQLEASPKMYQFGLITAGAKLPLTIQCPSPDDLEHLVSTMEYFIRNSRLGHDTALAGMPYSFQGVRLRDDGVVDKLWADSPMDKAGVQLGDHLWSVGTAASEPSNRKALETALTSSLPVTVYVVSPADWNNAMIAKNEGAPFRPRLRKVILSEP